MNKTVLYSLLFFLPILAHLEENETLTISMWLVISDQVNGEVIIEAHKSWAPLGYERFKALVEDHYYDEAVFFRVIPKFMAQIGLAADPGKTKKWRNPIKDDPPIKPNKPGFISFATSGKNTASAQIFINTHDNKHLDKDFVPFAQVTKGMDLVYKINDEYKEKPRQAKGSNQGNAYFKTEFPRLSYIREMKIMADSMSVKTLEDAVVTN